MKIIPILQMKLSSLRILILFLFVQIGLSQGMPIPKWIEDVYISNNPNLDSIRKEIEKLPKQNTNLQTFKNYTEPILEKDSSVNTLIKTMYVFSALIKDQDSIYYKNLDYETRFFCDFLFKKSIAYTSDAEFNLVRETYNMSLDRLPKKFTNKEMVIDKRKLDFYKKYMPQEPRLIGKNTLRYFRYDSIYQYNDLILKYILKSPDSVDWNQRPFIRTLPYEAVYTLAYFNDERVIPYLEKAVTVQGLDIREDIFNYFVSPFEGNEGEKIQLSLCKALLDRGDVLARKEVRSRATYKNITYSILDYVVVRCKKIFPQQYEQMKNIQDEKERLLFVKNLVDKRLQELDNKK